MKNNSSASRFEIATGDQITFATYRLDKNTLYIDYVFAPEELRGSGVAGKLMEEIAQHARKENLKIVPICGYAAMWLKRHKEHQDLLA
jgi:hypothetical protein